jgi:DNA-binding CsgD family transcriptional regulator
MSVSPYGLPEDFLVLINYIKISGANYMNALDLLNEKEKNIFAQMLKGLSMSEVADNNMYTADEVNNVRLQIIAKFEQASPVKSPETRSFKI